MKVSAAELSLLNCVLLEKLEPADDGGAYTKQKYYKFLRQPHLEVGFLLLQQV